MREQYIIASGELQDMPLVPDSVEARKAIMKHGATLDELMERYAEWEWDCLRMASEDSTEYAAFLNRISSSFLNEKKDQNSIYSPLSLYHALAAIADLSESNTRQEVLSVLGAPDIDTVRKAINAQYRANLVHCGMEGRPAAMLWFDETVKLDQQKIQEIANTIHVGTSQGCMTDPDYQSAISSWLSEVSDVTVPLGNVIKIDKDTRLLLFSTMSFHDKWEREFDPKKTKIQKFHAPDGAVDAMFMQKSEWEYVCCEASYTAVPISFNGGASLWFILPKEGMSPEDILNEEFFTSFLSGERSKEHRDVHMKIPKFDLSMDMEMVETFKTMGLREVFSDFSQMPYTTIDGNSIKIDKVKHSAKIKIDEEGCEATAYTVMRGIAAGGFPEKPSRMDFILDRPFLFVLMGQGKLPLFVGTVYRP